MKRRQIGYLVALGLTCGRLMLALVVILLAVNGRAGLPYLLCLLLAFISDYYDGVIARHFKVATAKLRRFDSMTDVAFYGASFIAVILLHPNIVYQYRYGLGSVLGLLLLRVAVDLLKFRREASYHMLSTKAWGISLFAALVALMGFNYAGWILVLAIILGITTQLEGLAATLILPRWSHDVPTIWHAYQIRQKVMRDA